MTTELDEHTEARVAHLLGTFDVEPAGQFALDPVHLRQLNDARRPRRADRKRHVVALGIAASVLAAAGISIGIVAATHGQQPMRAGAPPLKPRPKTTAPVVVGPHIVLTSEDESAMETLLAKYRDKPGVTRAAAKLVPYTDVGMIPGVRGGSPVSSPPSLVVAIALSGQIPLSGPVMTLPNGTPDDMTYELVIVNLSTGAVLSDTGGRPEAWPDGFDSMPNLPAGSVVPEPSTLQLTATDNGKTFEVAPSSTIAVELPGSAAAPWQLPPTPHVDAPVLVETDATTEGGSLVSRWTAAIDGSQTITSQATCRVPVGTSCAAKSWSVTVEVTG